MTGEKYTPKPGEVVVVSRIPECNFCQDGTPGPYDFPTRFGPWANGCERHWKEHRASPTLGVGKGQLWITEDQVAGDESGQSEEVDALATHTLVNDPPHGLSRVSRRTCTVCGRAVLQMPGGPLYGTATTQPCSE